MCSFCVLGHASSFHFCRCTRERAPPRVLAVAELERDDHLAAQRVVLQRQRRVHLAAGRSEDAAWKNRADDDEVESMIQSSRAIEQFAGRSQTGRDPNDAIERALSLRSWFRHVTALGALFPGAMALQHALLPAASRAAVVGGRILSRRSSLGSRPASARGFAPLASRARVHLEVRRASIRDEKAPSRARRSPLLSSTDRSRTRPSPTLPRTRPDSPLRPSRPHPPRQPRARPRAAPPSPVVARSSPPRR